MRKLPRLLVLFAAFFVGRYRKTWIVFFDTLSLQELCEIFFFRTFGFSLAQHRISSDMIGDFLLHLPFEKVCFFMNVWCVRCSLGFGEGTE